MFRRFVRFLLVEFRDWTVAGIGVLGIILIWTNSWNHPATPAVLTVLLIAVIIGVVLWSGRLLKE